MKNTKVAEIYGSHERRSVTVSRDFPLENLINLIAGEIALGPIFVINSKQQFLGLVRKTDLILWAHIKITGGKGRHEIPIWKFFKITDAKIAADLILDSPDVAVKENDTLQQALDKMLDFKEDILPVIDSGKKIVGDLRLSALFSWIQRQGYAAINKRGKI